MKALLILFTIFSLSTNAGWFGNDSDKSDGNSKPKSSVGTTINIDGGFGLRLGATYDQSFIKPASPNDAIFLFEEAGNWVSPSKPIDILTRYKLYVDDKKIAWRITAFGPEKKGIWSCEHDKNKLIKAIEKKYGTSYVKNEFEGNTTIAVNSVQNRGIEVYCAIGKALNYKGLPPENIFDKHSDDESMFVLRIDYVDRNIRNRYQDKIDVKRQSEEDSRINSYDI
jgi:copper chaperone CopZ